MPNPAASRQCACWIVAAQCLTAQIALPGAVPANASSSNASSSIAEAPRTLSFRRLYKASAFVTLFSVPILSRADVGFGFAGIDEQMQGSPQSLSLRFLSGSTPERTHGLNRFGFIQENVQERDRAIVAVDYFGLMTASGEESLDDAKAALSSRTSGEVPFVAARAIVERGKTRYAVRHLFLPPSYRGSSAGQLLRQVEAEFATPRPDQIDRTEPWNGQPVGTFLCSLWQAIQTDAEVFKSRITFNGKTFQFQASKRLDGKIGSELRGAGVTASPHAIVQLNGTLRNEKTNEVTNFRLWFEQGAANFLPLRFEFKPKSYLRLVFDAEPSSETLTMNREFPQ